MFFKYSTTSINIKKKKKTNIEKNLVLFICINLKKKSKMRKKM